MTAKSTGYQKLFAAALGSGYNVMSEVQFHETRKWRFDLLITRRSNLAGIAVEIDGGGFLPKGRHSTGLGMEKDNEKIAEAMILGHRVLRVTPRQVKNGKAIEWVQKLVAAGGPSAQVKTSSES